MDVPSKSGSMLIGGTVFLVIVLVVSGGERSRTQGGWTHWERNGPPTPAADHHVHVWSQDARDLLVRAQEEMGQTVIPEEEARPLTASDAVEALDSAGIERGVLLSTAYFFGIPDLEIGDEYARVRAENDYVGRQVGEYPDRLVGFFSFNPLADYALREMERLADRPSFAGVKLHLGNSGVSLRDSADVARLQEIFARANERDLAIVIHLGGRNQDFGAADAAAFLDEILPAAPDVPVQVAHMAGPGGLGPGTRASAKAFDAALEDHPERTRNLYFDLSGVPHPTHLAQGDTTLLRRIEVLNRAFVELAREIGFDRILFGSDFPAITPARYMDGLPTSLPITAEEYRDLVDDAAPYLSRHRRRR